MEKMMNEKEKAALKKQRFLLAIPVIVVPFVTVIFWLLGGGSGDAAAKNSNQVGLRAELPDATLKKEPTDKMEFYKIAEQDSLDKMRTQKADPYLRELAEGTEDPGMVTVVPPTRSYPGYASAQQSAVYERINSLQQIMKDEQQTAPPAEKKSPVADSGSQEIERLEKMMTMMQGGQASPSTEMVQVNAALESILDLQHPERVREKLKQTSEKHKSSAYAVGLTEEANPVSTLDGLPAINRGNGFFSFDEPFFDAQVQQSSIAAVVHEDQTVMSGSAVKLRLLNDVYVNGALISKDNFVTGIANLSGDRLQIEISSIRLDNSIFPVALSVYDLDGLSGINIPGAISRDVAKQGGERAFQGMGLSSYDPSLGAQAAAAGMEITKNLLSKKVKLVRVQLKAGYKVLLYDEKQKSN